VAGEVLFIVPPRFSSFSACRTGAMVAVSPCCPVCTFATALTMTTSHTYPRSCSHTYPGAVSICYGVPLWLCAGAFLTAGLVVGGRSAIPAADDDPSASLVSSRYLLVIQHASNRLGAPLP
jgi:hypothetical protein